MINGFTQSELNEVYTKLSRRKSELTFSKHLHEDMELGALSYESTAERAPTGYHQADQASNATDQEIYSHLVFREIKEMQDIEDALVRIEKGNYGLCDSCHQSISRTRLENVPEARYCEICESTVEDRQKLEARRPSLQRRDFNVK